MFSKKIKDFDPAELSWTELRDMLDSLNDMERSCASGVVTEILKRIMDRYRDGDNKAELGMTSLYENCINCRKPIAKGLQCSCLQITCQPESSNREDHYIGGYFPPPWDTNEHPEKTHGWIAFQEEQKKDPKYYGMKAEIKEDGLCYFEYGLIIDPNQPIKDAVLR